MSYADVLEQIQEFIVANGSNDITADVLRPILESILGQPNELIGDLGDSTVDGSTIVEMLNTLKVDLEAVSGITIHTGTDTPLVSPPATFLRGDFFAQIVASVSISFWQFNGLTWVPIKNWINDDLVETETTWSSAKIQEVINLQDVIISILPPTYAAGNITVQANAVWRIGGIVYTNPANVVKAVSNATAGMYRTDLLVANQTNSFDVIAGTESATVQLPPTAPVGTIAVTPIYVFGSTVDVPEPIVGEDVRKVEFSEVFISTGTGDIALTLDTEEGAFRILAAASGVTGVTGFDTTTLFDSSNLYRGKELKIANETGGPLTIKHDDGGPYIPIKFPSGVDFILQDKEVLILKITKTTTLYAEFISVSKDVFGGVGALRTYTCVFGINQTVVATPVGNTQWFCRRAAVGNNISAAFILDAALDVSTDFASHRLLSPCYSLPFQAKIKSVYVRGWSNTFNSTGVDFAVVKSKETGPTINGAIVTISNALIIARETIQIWSPAAGNGFLKQFDGTSLITTTLPLGSDIRLVFKNQNSASGMYDTLVTVEFEEVV